MVESLNAWQVAPAHLLGAEAVESLRRKRVALIGAGRRGSQLAVSLARSGVGQLVLFDRDRVRPTDLDSGVFGTQDAELERSKVEATAAVVERVSPWCKLEARYEEIGYTNAQDTLAGFDAIVDATRSHELKQVVNEVAFVHRTPFVFASQAEPARWLTMAVVPGSRGACFRCMYPAPLLPGAIPSVDNSGTYALADALPLGVLHRTVGLVLLGTAACGWEIDMTTGGVTPIDVEARRNPGCELCVGGQQHFLKGKDVTYSANLCEKLMVQIGARDGLKLDLKAQAERLRRAVQSMTVNNFMLVCEFEGIQVSLFANGRANVKGTKDPLKARGCYSDLLGV